MVDQPAGDEDEVPPNDVLRPIDAITEGPWPWVMTFFALCAVLAIVLVLAIGLATT